MKVKQYWQIVGQVRCLITGDPVTTFHHCHGGSMNDEYPDLARGKSQKPSDWLIIPISWKYHFGPLGVDTGCMTVREWERRYGRQADFLAELAAITDIDAVQMARNARQ